MSSRFEKGYIPWNKGLKGIHHSPKTEFKKGHLPHNTKYDGYISLRTKKNEQYYYIRIAKGKYTTYQRYLWEKNFGKIPEGMIIVFKDGNSLNCDLKNLEMISRAENLKRNTNYKKSAESVRNLWRMERLRLKYNRPQ